MERFTLNPSKTTISNFYYGKSIFITGCTGFLGKILAEKILFSLPFISKIYILIRGNKKKSMQERFQTDILNSPCFDRIRQRNPKILQEKFVAIEGDLLNENLISNPLDELEVINNVSVIFHSAATVDYNERLDKAVKINVFGTLKVLDLARKLKKLESFIQISTAYANCNRVNQKIDEVIYEDSKNPRDIIAQILSVPETEIEKVTPNFLGDQPNGYSLTKNLTEKLILKEYSDIPLCIVRPTIVGASMFEPMPGWIDAATAVAAAYLGTGLGLIHLLLGHEEKISDIIPADIVINALICASVFYCKPNTPLIVHVGSSYHNPVVWGTSKILSLSAWYKFPLEKAVDKVYIRNTRSELIMTMYNFLTRLLPLNSLKLVGNLLNSKNIKKKVAKFEKLYKKEVVFRKLFRHFCIYEWIYSTENLVGLMKYMTNEEIETFFLDPRIINWDLYVSTFLGGLKKYLMKDRFDEINLNSFIDVNWNRRSIERYSDIKWAKNSVLDQQIGKNNAKEMRQQIMNSPRVLSAIKQYFDSLNDKSVKTSEKLQKNAQIAVKKLVCDIKMSAIRLLAWNLRKSFRKLFQKVIIDEKEFAILAQFIKNSNKPFIIIPNHQSDLDFFIIFYLLLFHNIQIPFSANFQDPPNSSMLTKLLQMSGVVFSHNHQKSSIETQILYEYIQQLLIKSQNFQFFIEESQKNPGKLGENNLNILSACTELFFNGQITDIYFLPITIAYEKMLDKPIYENSRENSQNIFQFYGNYRKLLHDNLGKVYIQPGKLISLKEFASNFQKTSENQSNLLKNEIDAELANEIIYTLQEKSVILGVNIISSIFLMHRASISEKTLMKEFTEVVEQLKLKGLSLEEINEINKTQVLNSSLAHLKNCFIYKNYLFETNYSLNIESSCINILERYNNIIKSVFAIEAIVACSFLKDSFRKNNNFSENFKNDLISNSMFLIDLISDEFPIRALNSPQQQILKYINSFIENYISPQDISMKSEFLLDYFSSLIFPIIERYFIVLKLSTFLINFQTISLHNFIEMLKAYIEKFDEEKKIFYKETNQENIMNVVKIFIKKGFLIETKDSLIKLGDNNIENTIKRLEGFQSRRDSHYDKDFILNQNLTPKI